MKLSSPRFKAFSVSAGMSFWFFVIISTTGNFSVEILLGFIAGIVIITQLLAVKISKGLDIFAIVNTKIFLGILYIFIISVYGILFRILAIDPLRTKWKTQGTYWIDIEQLNEERTLKQY